MYQSINFIPGLGRCYHWSGQVNIMFRPQGPSKKKRVRAETPSTQRMTRPLSLQGRATVKQCVAKMGAHCWTYFVVLVVLFVSLNGKRTSKPRVMLNSEGKAVIVRRNSNAVRVGHIKKIETALTQIKKKLESLDKKITSLVSSSGSRSKLLHDFCLIFFSQGNTYTYIYILFTFPFDLHYYV